MHQQALEEIARQKLAEMRAASDENRRALASIPRQSLRTRTGWTLIDLGLKMIAEPRRSAAAARS